MAIRRRSAGAGSRKRIAVAIVLACAASMIVSPALSRAAQTNEARSEQLDYFAPGPADADREAPGGPSARPATSDNTGSRSRAVLPPATASNRAAASASGPLPLRIWMEWGSGAARRWQGQVRLDGGQISEVRPLGFAVDEPGSLHLADQSLMIDQPSPRSYDACTYLATGPADSVLSITLSPADQSEQAKQLQIPLGQLVRHVHRLAIDDRGNELVVRRAPGDQLQVLLDRDNLVFAPGEVFRFRVVPHWVDLKPQQQYRLRVELARARVPAALASHEVPLATDDKGRPQAIEPISIKLPAEEGAYDVLLSLWPAEATQPKNAMPLLQRSIQLVVVDTTLPAGWPADSPAAEQGQAKWRELQRIDPAEPSEEESLGGSMVTAHHSRLVRRRDRPLVQLQPGGWRLYRLNVRNPGRPHLIVVEYPNDVPQALGITIVEPDAAGQIVPPLVDSGFYTEPLVLPFGPQIERHRLLFWPRTRRPMLLMTCQRDSGPALYGAVRLLAGPERLPAGKSTGGPVRLLAPFFARPWFAENFSAGEVVDQGSGRVLKDWVTFHRGADRLIQYLGYGGYNAAAICVAGDGGAIYPSRLLGATPRYDDGAFFTTAQDPVPKDVLEMLLRMFDRTGLKLIAAIKFSGPLPELERLRRQGSTGIALVDAEGRPWRPAAADRRRAGPYYNVLDPRVQQAMGSVVRELVQRYSRHPSLAGVAIVLGPDTYAQLPGQQWGCDDQTLNRMAQETGRASQTRGAEDDRALVQRWLAWRAGALADWYRRLQQDVARAKPGAKLLLAGTDMLGGKETAEMLQPEKFAVDSFERLRAALLQVGIDPGQFQQPDLVLLRPAVLAPPRRGRVDLNRAYAAAADALFRPAADRETAAGDSSRRSPSTGAIIYHPPRRLDLPPLTAAGMAPGGPPLQLASQLASSGWWHRQQLVHQLASLDAQSILTGGWTAVMGQEETVAQLHAVYCSLPAQPFQTVPPTGTVAPTGRASSDGYRTFEPIIVRRLAGGQETFVYLVNDSPWPATATLMLTGGDWQMQPLAGRQLPQPVVDQSLMRWTVALAPFDLAAARFSAPDVQVVDWWAEVPPAAVAALRQALDDVRARIAARRRNPMPVLHNAGFEQVGGDGKLVGWQHGIGEGMIVARDDRQPHGGRWSLRLQSVRPLHWPRGPVTWLRSEPFDPPRNGRLALAAWLRVDDPRRQPRVRLVIEGMVGQQKYQRWVGLGAEDSADAEHQLGQRWSSFMLAVNDLPEGIKSLRVGLDVRDEGSVWVDDVEVLDVWLADQECQWLAQQADRAAADLESGKLNRCRQFLDSYAVQLLRLQLPPVPVHRAATAATARVLEPSTSIEVRPPWALPVPPGLAGPNRRSAAGRVAPTRTAFRPPAAHPSPSAAATQKAAVGKDGRVRIAAPAPVTSGHMPSPAVLR